MFKAKMRLADTGVSWTWPCFGLGFGVEGGWVLVGDDGGMVALLRSTLLPYAYTPGRQAVLLRRWSKWCQGYMMLSITCL